MTQTYRNEAQLQEVVAKYLDARGLLWFHPANERKTTPQAGARLKRAGVKAGVADCLIFDSGRARDNKGFTFPIVGVAIELKIRPNKPTLMQLNWMDALTKRNWKCAVCYTLDEVIAIVEQCYGK